MISLNFEIFLTHGCRSVILWSSWIVFIWNILFKCTTPSTNPNYVRGIIRLSAYRLSLLYPTQTLDIVVVFLWHFCWLCKIRLWENSPKPDSLKIYFLNLESIICKRKQKSPSETYLRFSAGLPLYAPSLEQAFTLGF